jgi:hypothetical protein
MSALYQEMQYPHWIMVAGAILVALGFIGLVFRKNRNGPVNVDPGAGNEGEDEMRRCQRQCVRTATQFLFLRWNSVFDSLPRLVGASL